MGWADRSIAATFLMLLDTLCPGIGRQIQMVPACFSLASGLLIMSSGSETLSYLLTWKNSQVLLSNYTLPQTHLNRLCQLNRGHCVLSHIHLRVEGQLLHTSTALFYKCLSTETHHLHRRAERAQRPMLEK